MSRKRRAEGSIAPRYRGTGGDRRQIPDRWLVRLSLGVDPETGAAIRTSRVFKGSKKEAEAFLRSLLMRKDQGQVAAGRLTLQEWLAEYAETWSSHLAPATRLKASQALALYLPKHLLGKKLRALTSADFQQLYNDLTAAGKSSATVRYFHRALNSRLEKAIEEGHLGVNPLGKVRLPKPDHREMHTLSPEHAAAFLEVAEEDEWSLLWHLLLLCGLRPEEALGLKWDDFDGEELQIRRALVRIPGQWMLEPVKTRRNRTIPLPAPVLAAVGPHRARQGRTRLVLGAEWIDHGLVFTSLEPPTAGAPLHWHNLAARHFRPMMRRLARRLLGRPEVLELAPGTSRHDARALRRAFDEGSREALKLTGLAGLRPYDLRHTFASLLMGAGEHPKVVADLMGHSKISLTLDTYSHVSKPMKGRATEHLAQIVAAGAASRRRA